MKILWEKIISPKNQVKLTHNNNCMPWIQQPLTFQQSYFFSCWTGIDWNEHCLQNSWMSFHMGLLALQKLKWNSTTTNTTIQFILFFFVKLSLNWLIDYRTVILIENSFFPCPRGKHASWCRIPWGRKIRKFHKGRVIQISRS